jgi:trans-2,3-dihydro-3-hydroxyanthranilate isomerase
MVRYEIVNMFADRPFAGSALGVVPDAEGLSADAMQAIAREISLTETAFVLPPSSAEATYRVRVFTPKRESPFGGHSSIGTAGTLARIGRIPEGRVVQECGPQLMPLLVSGEEVTVTGTGPLPGAGLVPEALLAACCLDSEALAGAVPRTAGFGPLFHFLPVCEGAVRRAQGDVGTALPDVFLFNWDSRPRTAHARLFSPGYGMPEDPACASAALGLGVWLAEAGWLPPGEGTHDYRIRQGLEMARPATLTCTVTVENGRPTAASVTGRVIPVASGEITAVRPASATART